MRISKRYASLPAFSANPDPPISKTLINSNSSPIATPKRDHRSKHKLKVERRRQAKREARLEYLCEEFFLDVAIDKAEDERTTMAKEDVNDPKRRSIDAMHGQHSKAAPGLIQKGINMGLSIRAMIKRAMRFVKAEKKRARFATKATLAEANKGSSTITVT